MPLQIQSIRENVEYYVESNHEADFQANDMIYDELELDELNSTLKNDVGTAAFSASDCDNEGLLVSQPSTPSSLTSHHHKVSFYMLSFHIVVNFFLATII